MRVSHSFPTRRSSDLAGRTGEAISFMKPREMSHLRLIEQVTKSKMKLIVPPTNKEAERGKQQAAVEKIVRMIEKGELDGYKDTASEMLEEHDSVFIVSAALKLLMKERKNVPVQISSVQPISVKNNRGRESNRRQSGGGKRFYGKRGQGSGGRNRKGNFQKRRGR